MEGPPFTKGKDIDSNRGIALSMKMGSLDFGLVPKSSLSRQFPESVQFHTPKPDSSPDENSKNRERSGPANLAALGGAPAALAKKYLALRVPLRHTWTVLYDWDSKKNDFLKANRRISFEAVIVHLGRGDIWKVTDHPDQLRHPGQSILFVIVDDYVHMVPFEIRGDTLWLVTVIPSRKATREYRKEKQNETEQRRKGT